MESRILPRLRRNRKSLRWSHPDGGPTLEIIPSEIVLEIAKYLLPTTKAALALASRTMLYRLGTEALRLGHRSRYNLLVLLFKDGICLPDILCPFCYIFHSPFPIPAGPSGPRTNTRACQTEDAYGSNLAAATLEAISKLLLRNPARVTFNSSPWLPAHVTFNTVAAVLRCHRHNSTAYTPETLASSDKFEIGDCKVHCYHDFRIVNGHLLLKTEKLVMPCKGKAKTTNPLNQVNLYQVKDTLLNKAWKVGEGCAHIDNMTVTWGSSLGFDAAISERPTNDCPIHQSQGTCFNCCTLGKRRVSFCYDCHTDWALASFVDLPGNGGRVCVLTTWKDLGSGDPEPLDKYEWQSHCIWGWRDYTRPHIYMAFEETDCDEYNPSICQSRLADLAK